MSRFVSRTYSTKVVVVHPLVRDFTTQQRLSGYFLFSTSTVQSIVNFSRSYSTHQDILEPFVNATLRAVITGSIGRNTDVAVAVQNSLVREFDTRLDILSALSTGDIKLTIIGEHQSSHDVFLEVLHQRIFEATTRQIIVEDFLRETDLLLAIRPLLADADTRQLVVTRFIDGDVSLLISNDFFREGDTLQAILSRFQTPDSRQRIGEIVLRESHPITYGGA